MLPSVSTLERIVASVMAHSTTELFESIANRLPGKLRTAIDLLVEVPAGDARSSLFRLKDYPKSANAAVIKGDIVRLHLIEELLGTGAELSGLDPQIVRQLGQLGRRYDARDLRRFAKPKRDALVACYLVEARTTLLDQIVEMNDLFLTGMNRRSRSAVELRRKSLRRRARDGLHRVLDGVDALAKADKEQTIGAFRDVVNAPALVEAAIACRAYERLETRGHLDAMIARYGTLRQYLPAFLALPFQAAAGNEALLGAIEILRALDAGTRGPLTTDDPHAFVQADWRSHLVIDDKAGGKLDRAIWEISLAFAIRNALRAGGLFLAQSRDHVSFWNLVYDEPKWQQAREQAYQRLDLPVDGKTFLTRLGTEFDRAARAAERPSVPTPARRSADIGRGAATTGGAAGKPRPGESVARDARSTTAPRRDCRCADEGRQRDGQRTHIGCVPLRTARCVAGRRRSSNSEAEDQGQAFAAAAGSVGCSRVGDSDLVRSGAMAERPGTAGATAASPSRYIPGRAAENVAAPSEGVAR